MYVCVYVCMYVCVYIYIYIYDTVTGAMFAQSPYYYHYRYY